jgi:hypothetical protein
MTTMNMMTTKHDGKLKQLLWLPDFKNTCIYIYICVCKFKKNNSYLIRFVFNFHEEKSFIEISIFIEIFINNIQIQILVDKYKIQYKMLHDFFKSVKMLTDGLYNSLKTQKYCNLP